MPNVRANRTKVVSPFVSPEAWAVFKLSGRDFDITLPGVIDVDVEIGTREAEMPVPGQTGTNVTFLGYDDARVHVTCELFAGQILDKQQTDAGGRSISVRSSYDWENIEPMLAALRGRGATKPEVYECYYPQLALHGIKFLWVQRVRTRDVTSTSMVVELELRQWQPTVKVDSNRGNSSGSGNGNNSGSGNGNNSGNGNAGGNNPNANKPKITPQQSSTMLAFIRGFKDGGGSADALLDSLLGVLGTSR